jgi:hypothetical protein
LITPWKAIPLSLHYENISVREYKRYMHTIEYGMLKG